ncbi:hypothetical protein NDU88_004740 [Pleurodeles waltl]|uniref:Uncharacterized protein n=1 Tax=Pleurodeles waltl TaxID=8319 RepID=A0AAV7NNJ2_PLEWA|nr:hypothetical protein NDU88_004740 [Pleurodeles waltl]
MEGLWHEGKETRAEEGRDRQGGEEREDAKTGAENTSELKEGKEENITTGEELGSSGDSQEGTETAESDKEEEKTGEKK